MVRVHGVFDAGLVQPACQPACAAPAHPCCAGFNVHDWVTENELELARAVQDYGAVLARGFPIPDASAFSAFVTGFTAWKDLPYEDSLSFAVRLPVTDRVCTTNEGKTG